MPSATPVRPTPARRSGFALGGRSVVLDPHHHAVRADLADVRLADRVFAPHYVEPVSRVTARAVELCAAHGGTVLARLGTGTAFDLLDVTGTIAWGIAVDSGLVGYLPADALVRPHTAHAA